MSTAISCCEDPFDCEAVRRSGLRLYRGITGYPLSGTDSLTLENDLNDFLVRR